MDLYNSEAENYVLGSVIDDHRCHDNVFGIVHAEDFKGEKQARIFRCLENLKAARKAIDLAVVCEELRATNEIDIVGGSAFVSSLISDVNAANVKYWVGKVKDLSKRRQLVQMAHEVMDMAKMESNDVDSIINHVDTVFLRINDRADNDYQRIGEFMPEVITDIELDLKSHGQIRGITTGIPALDKLTSGFKDDDYWIVGARPSVGKTAVALQLIINASSNKAKPGIFSAEMNRKALVRRMISNLSNIDGNAIRQGMVPTKKWPDIADVALELADRNIYVNDTPNISLSRLEASARKMVRKEGVNIIFIDYIGLIEYSNGNKMLKRNEAIGAVSRRLKGLARELKIPIVVLAQLNRDAENTIPTKANLKESGDLEQDADGIILLHNKEANTGNNVEVEMLFIVDKQRNGPLGVIDILHKKSVGKMLELEKQNFS